MGRCASESAIEIIQSHVLFNIVYLNSGVALSVAMVDATIGGV